MDARMGEGGDSEKNYYTMLENWQNEEKGGKDEKEMATFTGFHPHPDDCYFSTYWVHT